MSHPDRPHIILLCSDQHRPDWMSCGTESAQHQLVNTPTMDGLARRGVRMRQAYCAYPLCGPSRMSLMSGRLASRLGIYVNEHTLRSDVPTFAHALGRAGYETVLAGRMHFSGLDQRHGFERRLVGDMNASYGGGPAVKHDFPAKTASQSFHAATQAASGENTALRFDRCVSQAACRYLTQRAAGGERGERGAKTEGGDERPPLMTASFFQPHHPFTAPAQYVEAARRRFDTNDQAHEHADHAEPHEAGPYATGPYPAGQVHPLIDQERTANAKDAPSADQTRLARIQYAAMIDHLDALMGQVLDTASAYLDGPVVVMYVSDHGECAGDHGMWGKANALESSIRVPMLAAPLRESDRAGLGLAGDQCVDVPVSLTDLAPTLTGFAGAPSLPNLDGADLSPLLGDPSLAQKQPWADRAVRCEICRRFPGPSGTLAANDPCVGILRQRQWKLAYYHLEGDVQAKHPPFTLHEVEADPREQRNLAEEASHQATLEQLKAELFDHWDPAAISADATARAYDLAHTMAWAREGGCQILGPLEAFDDARPAFVFNHVGQRQCDL